MIPAINLEAKPLKALGLYQKHHLADTRFRNAADDWAFEYNGVAISSRKGFTRIPVIATPWAWLKHRKYIGICNG